MVMVGTMSTGFVPNPSLVLIVGDGVTLAVETVVGVGVGVIKLSTSSSLGETESCLVIIFGIEFFDRV